MMQITLAWLRSGHVCAAFSELMSPEAWNVPWESKRVTEGSITQISEDCVSRTLYA